MFGCFLQLNTNQREKKSIDVQLKKVSTLRITQVALNNYKII